MWSALDCWGVIDSTETPGGCWAHFSCLDEPGYRVLTAEQEVDLEWETFGQDEYDYRAATVRLR